VAGIYTFLCLSGEDWVLVPVFEVIRFSSLILTATE
jgi:hypothetical protein